jgi:hypothetical protein
MTHKVCPILELFKDSQGTQNSRNIAWIILRIPFIYTFSLKIYCSSKILKEPKIQGTLLG